MKIEKRGIGRVSRAEEANELTVNRVRRGNPIGKWPLRAEDENVRGEDRVGREFSTVLREERGNLKRRNCVSLALNRVDRTTSFIR